MCELTVKFGKFTENEINTYQVRTGERGVGFGVVLRNSGIQLIKGLDRDSVVNRYLRLPKPIVSVYHSRLPTSGKVNEENTQPFADHRRIFAHNGHLHRETSILKYIYEALPPGASDSRMLWEVVRQIEFADAIDLLTELGDRFVLVDTELELVALFGSWTNRGNPLWIRGFTYSYVLMDFTGRILQSEIIRTPVINATNKWWWKYNDDDDEIENFLKKGSD